MSDDRDPTILPPPYAPSFAPEKPTGVRRRLLVLQHKRHAKAYLAENAVEACALLRQLVKHQATGTGDAGSGGASTEDLEESAGHLSDEEVRRRASGCRGRDQERIVRHAHARLGEIERGHDDEGDGV